MQYRKRKSQVPAVLRRLFRDRARTLFDTIISLLPSPRPSPELCFCNRRRCLGCAADARAFLLRPDDPSDYRKLLTKCYVVVSENAPPVRVFIPQFLCPQIEVVKSTIEMLYQKGAAKSNMLCAGYYDNNKRSSPIVELLSCASWCLLLSRVGDDFMVYLLKNTSIFLPAPQRKHHQVGGPPINRLCFDMLKSSSEFDRQHPSLHERGVQKRKRTHVDDATAKKQKCHVSYSTDAPVVGLASSLGLRGKPSMQLNMHQESSCYDVSVSEAPTSTQNGKLDLNCISRLGKHSRPFCWQRLRRKKQKQITSEENSANTQCNLLPTNTDCLHACLKHQNTSLSYHEKLQMLGQCSCCSILQSPSAVPRRTEIKRQSIFYNLESSLSLLPNKHNLYTLRPNLTCSKNLIGNIFGFSDVNAIAQSMPCSHNSGSCLIDSACLYHSLMKWFKHVIRRTLSCKHAKFLDKHCAVPSLDQHKIGKSSSKLKDNASGSNVHTISQEFGNKLCADTMEAIDSQREAVKSYCSKSQVVSFIWAVSRSLLPSELLGTPPNWRIMRRNISKFIHLRRFEKFPFKLCMHELKTSRFPFLSNKYFLSSQNSWILKYLEEHNKFLHKEFRSWNDTVHAVKRKLLEKWIFWYFSCLVVPLVQANFYVTESEHGKQDIYYYRKSVWKKLTKSTIACFSYWKYSYLDDVAVREIVKDRPFGFSKLRLQPKENGVRMVANLKSSSRFPLPVSTVRLQYCRTKRKSGQREIKFENFQPVNSVLRDAHTVLRSIQFKEPQKLGSSVFDYNDVYQKLCPFLVSQKGLASTSGLFIVTSDVLKAFDSVDQDKLLEIMKDDVLPKNECFIIKQYDQVICTKKSLWVQQKFTMLDENYSQFTPFASSRSQHSVFVNQERRQRVRKEELFSNLIEHMKHNVLRFDGKFYLQGIGIPQGGVLSSLLCSFFYGHLESHVIFPFLEKTLESRSCEENNAQTNRDGKLSSPGYLLMRFIDDFLFISTSKKQAASFFYRVQRGFRGYNCYMNEKKFGANFDIEQMSGSAMNLVYAGKDGATSFVRWSGLLINCSTMEILADYTRYLNNHLSSTLTVCWQGKPGIHLKEKLRLFLRPKCHPIFFDSNINSDAVVKLNIYQIFLISAMKFHCYIRDLSFVCKFHKRFCSEIIQSSLRYMYRLIKKRIQSVRRQSGIRPILKLEKEEVEWLGLHAFVQVLRRKQSRHRQLLAVLRSMLSSHRMSEGVSPELQYATNAENSSLVWDIKY